MWKMYLYKLYNINIYRMETAFGIITSAGLVLLILSDYGVFTAVPVIKPSPDASVINQHIWQTVNKHVGQLERQSVEKSKCIETASRTLECQLPVLDSSFDLSNYSVSWFFKILVHCDKKRSLPSRLSDGVFEKIGQDLAIIKISYCNFIKISKNAFRGLKRLNFLSIEGENNSQQGKTGLKIFIGSNLTQQIETVHTSSCATTTCDPDNLVLPNGIFSELDLAGLKLTTMRLTSTIWQVVKSLRNLKLLNLNKNKIKLIDINVINKLQKLDMLSLNDNYIQVIRNGSFESLSLLQRLFLSRNKIRFLERDAFKGLSQLIELWLSGNSIHTLNTGTFNGLHMLEVRGNNASSIAISTFESLTNLDMLDLAEKSIHTLKTGTFNGLTGLHALYLTGNNISTIEINTFESLTELDILDLSENSIHTLNMGTFNGLTGLYRLNLTGNNISTIENNTFASLPELVILDLSGNSFHTLNMRTFNGLTGLYRLNLAGSSISTIENHTFASLTELVILDLSGNNISTLETDTFTGLCNIRQMFLAENHINTIALEALSPLKTLQKLHLSDNRIKMFPTLPSSLKSLLLSNNDIVEIDTTSFARLTNLSMLDLSHNTIREFTHYTIPNTIEKFNISSNNISVTSFNLPSNLAYADFRNNQLKSLKVTGLQKYRGNHGSGTIYFAGNGNPFNCVCNLEVFNNGSSFYYDSNNVPQYHIWDFASIICSSKFMYEPREITEIPLPEFSCQYHTSCPQNCTCYLWNHRENINIVSCLNAGSTSVPVNISETCTILDLSGNMFHSLVPGNFDGSSQLTELYLNASNVTEIKEGTFRNLLNLGKLDLGHNNIYSLDSGIFTGLTRLFFLDLSFNSIHVLMENTFESLTGLKYLDLSRNKLETITTSVVENVHNMYTLQSLYLSNNHWSCNCTFLEKFLPLTRTNGVQDQGDIICFMSNNTKYQLIKIDLPDFCPDNDNDSGSKPMSTAEIALTIGFSVFVIGTILFCILLKNKNFIRLLCFIKCGWRPGKNEMDRYYDAFVSFNKDDTGFIVRELMPRLEVPRQDRPAYNLCIHFRDFPVGSCIANTILAAIRHSKRVIIILSNNFLQSEWCHYEFQAAHQQVIDEKTNRIIMVLLQDINTDLLDAKLKLFLRTRKYVKYGDPRSWDKIEYVMPKQKKQGEGNLNVDNIDNVPADNMQDDAPLLR